MNVNLKKEGENVNVIIANQQANILGGLNIEVIKSIQGEYNVDDIINGFFRITNALFYII